MLYRWERLTKQVIKNILCSVTYILYYALFSPLTLSRVQQHSMIMLNPYLWSVHRMKCFTWKIRTFIIQLLFSNSLTWRTHLWHLLLYIQRQMMFTMNLWSSVDPFRPAIKKTTNWTTAILWTSFCSCQMSMVFLYIRVV